MRFLVYGLKKQQSSKVSFLITKMHTNLYLLSTQYDIQVIRMMIIITLVCINKAEFKVNLKWHLQPILLSYNYVFLRTFNEKKNKWGARLEFIHQELTACWNILYLFKTRMERLQCIVEDYPLPEKTNAENLLQMNKNSPLRACYNSKSSFSCSITAVIFTYTNTKSN